MDKYALYKLATPRMGYNTTELNYEQNKLDNLGGFTTIPSATPVNKYVNRSTYDLSDSWYAKTMDRNYLSTPTGRQYPNLRPTMAATNLFAPYRPGMRGVMDDDLADRVAEQQQLGAKNVMQQRGMKPTAAQKRHIDRYWNESSFYNRRNAKGQAFDLQEPVLDESITDPNMRQFVTDTGKGMANNFTPNNINKVATVYRDTLKKIAAGENIKLDTPIGKAKDLSLALMNNGVSNRLNKIKHPNDSYLEDGIDLGNRSSNPLALPKAIFKPTTKGYQTMQHVENLTQQARRRHFPNAPTTNNGSFSAIDYSKINPDALLAKLPHPIDYNNRYYLGIGRAYAPTPRRAGFLDFIGDTYDTLIHETNHFNTPSMQPGAGTHTPGMAVVPGFEYGDEGTKLSLIMQTPQSNAFTYKDYTNFKKKLQQMIYHGAFNPGYPLDQLPFGYNNSLGELTANTRTLKQFAGSKEVPSAGMHPNLSDATLANGTVPFNKAMVDVGIFKANPKWVGATYDPSKGEPWKPRYLKGPTVNSFDGAANLRNATGDIRAQLNYMQYLIDLGPNRTPYHNKILKEMQRKMPMIMEVSDNYNGMNNDVTHQVDPAIPNNYMGGYTSPVAYA